MQESVIYQDILQKGIQQGLQTGLQQGLQTGLQQGLQTGLQQGELAMLRRLLVSRLGALSPQLDEKIQKLSMTQLEDLGAAIFNFSSVEDIASWLQAREQQ